jgi:hypothetical protein
VLAGLRLQALVGSKVGDRLASALDESFGDTTPLGLAILADENHGADAMKVGWMERARVLFRMVDEDDVGWVKAQQAESLVRDFLLLQRSRTDTDGTLASPAGRLLDEFLRELADESDAVIEGAVEAETASVMSQAVGGRLYLEGFQQWLLDFIESLEEQGPGESSAFSPGMEEGEMGEEDR